MAEVDSPENHSWAFSVITGLVVTLSILYLANCIRLKYMPQETRNKLTMIIWWSLFLNLVALQIENSVMRLLNPE